MWSVLLAFSLSACEKENACHEQLPVPEAPAGENSGNDADDTPDEENTMKQETFDIKIKFGNHELSATLSDNATTRAFVKRLPVTLPMLDLYSREMCYRFPEALPTDDVNTCGYEVGEIVYYPPMHSFVIMYAQNRERFSMQKLGKIDSGVEAFRNAGDMDVTFESANE